ncbi:family 78 glycoside hydrolase catalytic domain [Cohnella yongneupensis]|uniref:Family 78 glycoside hydrolase catalytic domain n=1 Tax=Cohnella yongneupensis TaxID=425006 RepID=A0ABW0R2G8_9BACL
MKERKWQAEWIWGGAEASPRNEWRCFRKTFDCPVDAAADAELHITADSRYALYVNGTRVGRGPVRSWPSEQFYDTHKIGHLLLPGRLNTIAVLVLHFGLGNFYYVRGRGGLAAEAESGGTCLAATDGSWRTAKLAAQRSNSPRMSCQQAFAEVYDARLWEETWVSPVFEDGEWPNAEVVCPVGGGPWKKLIARDIPFLTEEKQYPSRIVSMAGVKTPVYSAAIDLRAQMVPASANHANHVGYSGYLATVLHMPDDGAVTVGFPNGVRTDRFYVDGNLCAEWTGEQPERYYRLPLSKGDHLLLADVTSVDHGGSFHIGVDGESAFALRSPLGAEHGPTPFITVGPFDTVELIDHRENVSLDKEHPAVLEVGSVASEEQLRTYAAWIRPVDPGLITEEDVFGANVWRTKARRFAVPAAMNNAILPVPEPAVIPTSSDDIELVVDLGKMRTGFVGFEVEAPAGTIIDAYGIEYMQGDYRQHTYGLDNTFRYICRSGRQAYESPVRRGCRYVILTFRNAGSPVKLHEVYFNQSTYPVAEIGSFRCSDPLLNEIWEISRHTTKLCMEDTFVDCPTYEQVFWVGDSRNEALVNYYVYGATDIVKRCLKLVPGSGDMTPLFVDQVPSAWSSVIPNWTFFWVIACEEYVHHTGDTTFAEQIWPSVRHTLIHYLQHVDTLGLLNMRGWNLLDWAPIDQPDDGIVTHQNLFLVKALRQAVRLAESAGRAEAGKPFSAAVDRLFEAINAQLWDDTRQAYLDCVHSDGRRSSVFSMQTQVSAYLCGVADGERKRIIEGYLVAPPADFVQIGSPFMSFFYYETLREAGRYGQMLDDIRFNYGRMIEHGATTCWETYPNFEENRSNPNRLTRSHCHAWSAAPGYFLGESILGVRQAEPGWKAIVVEPRPCDLTWASGRVPLPQGDYIEVSWRLEGQKMKLRIEAPDDIRVDARFPEGVEGHIERRLHGIGFA